MRTGRPYDGAPTLAGHHAARVDQGSAVVHRTTGGGEAPQLDPGLPGQPCREAGGRTHGDDRSDAAGRGLGELLGHGHALHRLAVMGFNPARNGHGGWFDFVRDMDDPVDGRALVTVANLLRRVERDRSFTPPALEALLHLRNGTLTPDDGRAFWAFEPLLSASGDRLRLTRPNPDGQAAAMLVELAEWRLGTMPDHEADDPAADFTAAGPDLWRQYLREAIPPLFGPRFSPGNWNAGIVRLDLAYFTSRYVDERKMIAGQLSVAW